MAQYIVLPDGTYYAVKEGESSQQATRRAMQRYPEAFEAPQKEAQTAPQQAPEGAGFDLGDTATALKQGIVGSTKALTDAFGANNAASQFLDRRNKELQSQYSPARQAEQQRGQARMAEAEKSGSTMEQIKAGLQTVGDAPVQSMAQGIGSLAPYLTTGALVSGLTRLVTLGPRAVGALTAIVNQAPKLIGTVQGMGAVKGAIYDAVYEAELKDGVDEATAKQKALEAQAYTGQNLDQIALGGGVGFVAGSTGMEKLITPAGAAGAAAKTVPRIARAMGAEMVVEGPQEGHERAASNIALQRTGRDVGTWEGVPGAFTQGAAMGALSAGPVAAVRGPGQPAKPGLTEERQKAAERAKALADERAAYEQSPAFVADIAARHDALVARQKALNAAIAEPVAKDDMAGQARLAELRQERKEFRQDPDTLQTIADYNKNIERVKAHKMSPQEYAEQQQGTVRPDASPAAPAQPTGPSGSTPMDALMESSDTVGQGQPAAPEPENPAQTRVTQLFNWSNEQPGARPLSQGGMQDLAQLVMEDPAVARQYVATRPNIPGMRPKEQTTLIKRVEKGLADLQARAQTEGRAGTAAAELRNQSVEMEEQAFRDEQRAAAEAQRKEALENAERSKTLVSEMQALRGMRDKPSTPNIPTDLFGTDPAAEGSLEAPVETGGPARRVEGGFRLFNAQGAPDTDTGFRPLQQRVARLLAEPNLTDEAYQFLRSVEDTMPQLDTQVEEAREGGGQTDVASLGTLYNELDSTLNTIERGEQGVLADREVQTTEPMRMPRAFGQASTTPINPAFKKELAALSGKPPATVGAAAQPKDTTRSTKTAGDTWRTPTSRRTTAPLPSTPETLRGKTSSLQIPRMLQDQLKTSQRVTADDSGQQALFANAQKELATAKDSPEAFARFMRSPFVNKLRKDAREAKNAPPAKPSAETQAKERADAVAAKKAQAAKERAAQATAQKAKHDAKIARLEKAREEHAAKFKKFEGESRTVPALDEDARADREARAEGKRKRLSGKERAEAEASPQKVLGGWRAQVTALEKKYRAGYEVLREHVLGKVKTAQDKHDRLWEQYKAAKTSEQRALLNDRYEEAARSLRKIESETKAQLARWRDDSPDTKALDAARDKVALLEEAIARDAFETPEAKAIRKEAERGRSRMAEQFFAAAQAKTAKSEHRGQQFTGRSVTDLGAGGKEAASDGRIFDVLDDLESNGSTPFVRAAAAKLRPFLLRTKLRTQETLRDENGVHVEGLYDAKTNTVSVDEALVSEEVVLHELTHAATLRALVAPDSELTAAQQDARSRLKDLYNEAKETGIFEGEYALTNLQEFVAEINSNEGVRAKLDAKTPGFVRKVFDAILEMLGVAKKTVSEAALADIEALFQPSLPFVTVDQKAVASVMRGVFPDADITTAEGTPDAIASAVSSVVGRGPQHWWQKVLANATGLGFRTQFLDAYAPIEELVRKGVEKGSLESMKAFQTMYFLRFGQQRNQFLSQAAGTGVPQLVKSADGDYSYESADGPNLASIARTLSDAKIGDPQQIEGEFTAFLAIRRAMQTPNGFSKLNLKSPMTETQARAFMDAVNADPARKNAFEAAATEYKAYNGQLLDLLVQTGAMEASKATALKRGDFVPFYRQTPDGVFQLVVMGENPVRIGDIRSQPYLQELMGDDEKILPVFTGAMQNTSMLLDMAMRNQSVKSLAYSMRDMGAGIVGKGQGPQGARAKRDTIVFKDKGKEFFLKLDSDAYGVPSELLIKGLEGIKTTLPFMFRGMAGFSNILRAGVTRMPAYAFRQMIRDPINAFLVTGGDFVPVVSSFKEMAKMQLGDKTTEQVLERSGAISSNVFSGDKADWVRIMRDISANKKGLTGAKDTALSKLDAFATQSDTSTRSVLYNMYRDKGMSHIEALMGSLESMNFSRRGASPSMQVMSMMVPFFNAQIQGLDVIYRAARGHSLFENEMDVQRKLLVRGGMMMAATIAYAAAMQDDEAYKNASEEVRANNYFVRLPGMSEPLKLPIPFELGYAFKAIPELIFNVAAGTTSTSGATKALAGLAYDTVPFGLPQAIKPTVEVVTNHSFFGGRPITGPREAGLDVDQQFRQNTTELAKLLGKNGVVSPLQIEHLVRGYTGGMGILLMQLTNVVLRPLTDADAPARSTSKLSEMPLIGPLFQPSDGRGFIDEAYAIAEEFNQKSRTYKNLVESGKKAEAAAYAQRYANEIAGSSIAGALRQRMGEFAKYRRAVQAHPTMTSAEKRASLDALKQAEIRLAERVKAYGKREPPAPHD